MSDILSRLRDLKLVPIVTLDDPDDAVPLARALADGGLPCTEITFRTDAAARALDRIASELPDILLGAGTVLAPDQVDEAKAAGARFVVSPGLNARVVERCKEVGLAVFPGVATPTEVEAAMALGLSTLKLFPAEPMGGARYLKAMSAPYGDAVRFIPTGGVDASNLASWLALPQVVACGGSWMVPRDRIRAHDFDEIRDRVAEAVRIARTGAED